MNQMISEQIHLKNITDLKLHLKLNFMFIIDCFSSRDLQNNIGFQGRGTWIRLR